MSDFIDKYADHLISEPVSQKLKSIINARALGCAFILLLPTPALDDIIYAILLWTMYGKLAKAAGVPFKDHFIKNTIGGFIVNLLVIIIIDSIGDLLSTVAIGFVISFAAGFFFTKMSGHMFVNQLKVLHGDKVANHPNVRTESVSDYNQQQINTEYNNQAFQNTSQYYLHIDGQQSGPFNLQQLQQKVANEQTSESTLVWKEGMPNWIAANSLPELADLFSAASNQNILTPPPHNATPPAYNPSQQQLPQHKSNNLIMCPDCEQMVSRRAYACPNCGCPITE